LTTPITEAPPPKPLLRGVLHQWAAVVAVVAGGVLAATAPSARGVGAALGFTASLVTLFAVSATYHRVHWQPQARAWMRRADHASIFILIAGTYTPIALAALPPALGHTVLMWVWGGAVLGVLQSLFWVQAPKAVPAVLAVCLGWVVLAFWAEITAVMLNVEMTLLFVGGVFYTIGAVAYALKRPNPWPRYFGYHEVFPAMTLVAAKLHFIAVASVVGRAVD
jgi:hemolysin III